MFLDPKDSLRLSLKLIHEPLVTELIKREVKHGDTLLDIGAHIGYFTLILARLVGEGGRVFAFEPDPSKFAIFEKNVRANGYRNVILVQKAVSNTTEKALLYSPLGDLRIIYKPEEASDFIEVEAIRLDDCFKASECRIDFAKIDLEGAEGAVIQGISREISTDQSAQGLFL